MRNEHQLRSICIAAAAAAAIPFTGAQAAEDDTAALERRVADLEQQVESMRDGDPDGRIDWSGLIEVEMFSAEDFSGSDSTDVELATLELGAEAAVNDWVTANALLLYEGGTPEDVEVDEAIITIAPPDGPWSATAGRTYVPFGAFETAFISDPLPLEVGETQETAVIGGLGAGPVHGAAYVFNGDSNDGGGDDIEHFGLSAVLEGGDGDVGYRAGVGYISSIADTDGISGAIPGPALDSLDDYVGGIDLHASLATGPVTFIAEYLAATDAFDAGELAFDGGGAEPAAWQTEVGFGFELAGAPATASLGIQGTDEAVALGLAETRVLAGLAVEPWEATTVALELKSEDDYDTSDGGSGNSADALTVQLATAF